MKIEILFILLLFGLVGAYYNYNYNRYNYNNYRRNYATSNRYNSNSYTKNYNAYYKPLQTYNRWGYDRRPRVMGRTLPMKALMPMDRKVQQKILSYHNHFRSSVKPVASDMLAMRWHLPSANAAQRWADNCQMLTHDSPTGRYVNDFGSCGQNIFVSNQKVPWYFAIETWYLEKRYFTYGYANNSLEVVGHYTQLVWASSHKVGCGIAKCYQNNQIFYNYVCNYCPTGNYPEYLSRPYKRGKVCGSCRNSCDGRLCTNSCQWEDQWANCGDLVATWPQWLCNDLKRRENCKATCFCNKKSSN